MYTGLSIERNGSADEVPLTFTVTKVTPFAEDASFKFRAEVWCPQSEFSERSLALRNFVEEIRNQGSARSFDLVFGPPKAPPGMKVHAGTCTVKFFLQESGDLAISTNLLAVPPGANSGDRYDTCTINFEARLSDVHEFQKQLQKSSLRSVSANLYGLDAVT